MRFKLVLNLLNKSIRRDIFIINILFNGRRVLIKEKYLTLASVRYLPAIIASRETECRVKRKDGFVKGHFNYTGEKIK